MLRKVQKLSHDHFSVHEQPCESNMCTNRPQPSLFDLLPAEILSKIVNYLNPLDLVSLNYQRVTDISLTMKYADFSVCNTVHMEDMSAFFTEDRVLHIQEINFHDIFFVNSSTLEKFIVKCKNLRKLSVFKCGLSCSNIISILESCEELKELHWNLARTTELTHLKSERSKPLKLEKLYIIARNTSIRNKLVNDLLKRCPSLSEICWNGTIYLVKTYPITFDRNSLINDLNSLRSMTLMLGRRVMCLMQEYIPQQDILEDYFIIFAPGSSIPFPGFVHLFNRSVQKADLTKFESNSFNDLVIHMIGVKQLSKVEIEQIKDITGDKLTRLTMYNRVNYGTEQEKKLCVKILHNLLTEMTSTCMNILTLNIAEFHFDEEFCFNSLCHLTKLKVLKLPACALKTAFTKSKDYCIKTANLQVQRFKNFVLQCKNVEKFSLFWCTRCHHGPSDEDIRAIAMWPKLKCLLIAGVGSLHNCNVLSHVAYSCPNFHSLELIDVGLGCVSHILQNVVQVLLHSKRLMFLRINLKKFNFGSPLFWSSVASARNLQGLCLSSELECEMKNEIIPDALIKLPYFHLCHLHLRLSMMMEFYLKDQIKEIMKNKEAEVSWTDCSPRGYLPNILCEETHFS